jgi:membrane fusion protein (multidrug efflux system)
MSAELEIEKAKREAAERAADEAIAKAASEQAAREQAEKSAREAQATAASERAAREEAVQSANKATAELAYEKAARQAAEKLALEAGAKAQVEKREREAAESLALEALAKGKVAPASPAQVPAQASATAKPAQTTGSPKTTITSNWLVPLLIFAAAGILFVLISGFWTTWESAGSVTTDDAYVRADVAPLSTKVSGVVRLTAVNDFDKVKAGQILVELKNDEYKARVEQAQQAIREAEIKLSDMKQRKEQQDARVTDAQTAIETSRTDVRQADDRITAAQATIEEAKAGIKEVNADVGRTSLERDRQEALFANESATKQGVEQVQQENDRATASLDAHQAQLKKATQQLSICKADKEKSLLAVQSRQSELTAQRKQRELLDGEEQQLVADLASKKAGLTSTQVDLDYTIVRAPIDGVVGELKVKPGQLVSAGTQVITVVSSKPWIIANYRETQLSHVKAGDRAQASFDALPGLHLKGHVESIAPASGAQFSLLPPDNASGNFTKIIQRIAVKIVFDEPEYKLANLRPGMSTMVTIKASRRRH